MSVESFRGPGGAKLFYRYDDFTDPWEDAPTAFMAHGQPRNSNLWYAWVPALSRHLRIVRTDLRGLGLSKVPLETFKNSLDSMMLDAIALMDHLRLSKVIWIGEATGAIVGLSLAIRVPERLHGLVVMSAPLKPGEAHPRKDAPEDPRRSDSAGGHGSVELMLTKGMREWARASVRSRPWMNEAPSGYVEWYIDQISSNDSRLVAEVHQAMPTVDLTPVVKDIGVPTMYLVGDRDPVLTDEHRELLEQVPNVRLIPIEGPGIDIGYARPDACAAEVKVFLRELGVLSH